MSKKKKIVRIITRLNIGGPAIHTILLSSELSKDGYEDLLLCGDVSESEGDMLSLAKAKDVMPFMIPELGREISFGKDLGAFLKIYSFIKKEKPDIVHTHTAKAGALGRLAAILAGVPVRIHTFHGHIFDGYFNPFKAKVFLFIERFLALFTDKVITVSENIKDDITRKLKVTNAGKCAVIRLGLELEKFLNCESRKGAFRKRLGIDNECLLVGIVGRLVPIKNHKMFLDVARMIKKDLPGIKVKFIVVGDGESGMELRQRASEAALDEVIFTSWIDDLSSVYSDLDIVALTSLNEGTPVSLIEAMASGKPVVATDVGGVKDLVRDGENGFLARSRDAGDFSQKLSMLLRDGEMRSRFGMCGREAVKTKYSKERLVKEIKDLYNECLGKETLKQ